MSRLVVLAAAALLVSSGSASAQVYFSSPVYRYGPSAARPYSPSFAAYGVPNGSLHRTFPNGVSYYPYYNFGGLRTTFYSGPQPYYGSTWGGVYDGRTRGRGWRR